MSTRRIRIANEDADRLGAAARSLAVARGIAVAVGLALGCALDAGSTGGKPTLGDTGTGTSTGGDGSGESEVTADDTAAPIPEGPRRRRLSIDPAYVGTAGDVPVLVTLDATRIEYADTQPGGADVRFFAADGVTRYDAEIERWDPSGLSFLWVRIDDATLPDHFLMDYADGEAFEGSDPAAVWEGFAAVWHMQGEPGPQVPDSTAAQLHLHPAEFGGDFEAPGRIGLATSFIPTAGAATGPLQLQDPLLLQPSDAVTIEAWVWQSEIEPTAPQLAVVKRDSLALQTVEPMQFRPRFDIRTPNAGYGTEAGGAVGEGWTYLVATYQASDGALRLHRNGVAELPQRVPGTARERMIQSSDQLLTVGRNFRGTLDEVRVSMVARSAEWVALQHASMTDALLDYGPAQAR